MQVVEYHGSGGPEVIRIARREIPEVGEGQLLIKVAAAGVNKPDIFQRQGNYPPPPGASDIPGLEVSGHIVSKGPNTSSKFELGQSVCALIAGGGYAEYCVVAEDNALTVPKQLSLVEAAAVPETFCTVWTNLFQDGELSKGHSVLIHGGSSGIGTTAIQLAKLFGASPVIVTVGSKEKADACLKLGADYAINYKTQDFVAEVLKYTNDKGVDRILDMVGGDYVNKNYACAAKYGRISQIATLNGTANNVNLFPLMVKRLIHTGSTLRARPVEEKKLVVSELENKVWPKLGEGVKPVISATFPFAEAAKAHELMDSSQHIGKIVLTFV